MIAGIDDDTGTQTAAHEDFVGAGGRAHPPTHPDRHDRLGPVVFRIVKIMDERHGDRLIVVIAAGKRFGEAGFGLGRDEFVGVEKNHPIGPVHLVGEAIEPGVERGFVEPRRQGLEHGEGKPLVLERFQDGEGTVGAAVVEKDHVPDMDRVVAHEGFDDIVFVQDAGDGNQAHRPHPPCIG